MARIALHPQVGHAVELADYRMEEIEVSEQSNVVGKTIEGIRGRSVIVALRRADGRLEPQPSAQTELAAGDRVVALGTPETLDQLETSFQPASEAAAQ
jgi:voltage-gated potassium channel